MTNKIEKRTRWECPEEGGVPLLTMPNIPKPLHNRAPRTILGQATWDKMRKRAYYLAGYKSEISGELSAGPGGIHAHEAYTINYIDGTSVFKRIFAITPLEHVYFIHSGRALTLFKQGNPMYSAKKLLEGAEHGFRLIYEWNKAHPDKKKLKAYATLLEYLKQPELAPKMRELIDKYEMEFWEEDKTKYAPWDSWKLVLGNKQYPTLFKSYEDWEKAMEKVAKKDPDRQLDNPFQGGVYDELKEIFKKGEL